MTATIGIDLGKLSLTDAEKRELDSALNLLEASTVKQESVLEKYSGLILCQVISLLGESEEGYRDIPDLAEQSKLIATYLAPIGIANILRQFSEQAKVQGESTEYQQALDEAADVLETAGKAALGGMLGGSVEEALKAITGETNSRTSAKLLGSATGALTSSIFLAYDIKTRLDEIKTLEESGAPLNEIAQKKAELSTIVLKEMVSIPTTTIAGAIAGNTSAFATMAAKFGTIATSATTAAALSVAFELGWKAGTLINENVDWLQDGSSLKLLDSIFGPDGFFADRDGYSSDYAAEFGLFSTFLRALDLTITPQQFNRMLDASGLDFRNLAEARALLQNIRETFGLGPIVFSQQSLLQNSAKSGFGAGGAAKKEEAGGHFWHDLGVETDDHHTRS